MPFAWLNWSQYEKMLRCLPPKRSEPWWRNQMETFSALLAICTGNSPVTGEFRAQRPVTRSFDVFFDLPLNKRLSNHSWGWWSETLSGPLWRHSNAIASLTPWSDYRQTSVDKALFVLQVSIPGFYWQLCISFFHCDPLPKSNISKNRKYYVKRLKCLLF